MHTRPQAAHPLYDALTLQCDYMLLKVAQFPPKTCPKSSHRSFYFKRDPLQKKLRKSPNIWATFITKFDTKNFKISPKLVTLQS